MHNFNILLYNVLYVLLFYLVLSRTCLLKDGVVLLLNSLQGFGIRFNYRIVSYRIFICLCIRTCVKYSVISVHMKLLEFWGFIWRKYYFKITYISTTQLGYFGYSLIVQRASKTIRIGKTAAAVAAAAVAVKKEQRIPCP